MSSIATKSRASAFVERLLSIPPEPHPPTGAHTSVRTFRASRGFYRYQLLKWGAKQLAAIMGLAIGIAVIRAIPDFPYKFVLDVIELAGATFYLATIPFTYLMVHLDYQLRWYIVTDRSLRIREGLLNIREQTMSFANIQQVSVRQGPIQRVFGIADVEVRTAGGGAPAQGQETSHADMHRGYFRGVDNAEEIRDAILARVRQLRDSGLGDPDAHFEVHALVTSDALAAARDILDEARALRIQASARSHGALPDP